ncbi:MAG: hypothetical protein A2219_06220 [Elusimicrobia bacterium RIFOXYA2_FULL_50_26]|nr:MAG: hypothetical protein A2219_06220 [Elusimicrobia bacterium RIFOXYA2_FULL_50_26]
MAIPEGQRPFCPASALLRRYRTAEGTRRASRLESGQNWRCKIHLIGLTGHRVDSKPHLPGGLSYSFQ